MRETTTADIRAGFIESWLGDGSYIDQDDVRALNASEFDAWLKSHDAEVERAAAEKAWQEGAEAAFYNPEIRGYVDYPDENPYRAEAYRREGKE